MSRGRPLLILAAAISLAACSGGGDGSLPSTSGPATTLPATTVTSAAAAPTTSLAPPTSTAASGSGCQGIDVENPAIVALSPVDGAPCWSALSGWNAYAATVTDGKLLVLGGPCSSARAGQTMVAIDASTGQELWRHNLDGVDTSTDGGTAALGTGSGVVVPPSGGRVEGIDLATGKVRWTRAGRKLADGPDTVVVASTGPGTTVIELLDRSSGESRWGTDVGPDMGGTTADSSAVLVTTGESTVAYDAGTGVRRWEAPFTQASDTYAVRIVDGVATGSADEATVGYDVATGTKLWTNPGYPPQRPEPTDGNVYVVLDGGVGALDPRTGDVRWTVEGANLEAGPGLVLLATDTQATGTLEAVDPATGQTRWTKPIDEANLPAVDTVLPSGFMVAYQNVLPSAEGVFFAYGNCLGS